jgi:hypothetical protein
MHCTYRGVSTLLALYIRGGGYPESNSLGLDVNTHKNSHIKASSMPKKQEKQQTIDEILSSLDTRKKDTLLKLRQLIRDSVPESVEMVKQGKLAYKLEGKDFVWISHTREHVDLDFAMGSSLSSNLLRSRGTAEQSHHVRHVAVYDFASEKPELERLVRDAAELGFEH